MKAGITTGAPTPILRCPKHQLGRLSANLEQKLSLGAKALVQRAPPESLAVLQLTYSPNILDLSTPPGFGARGILPLPCPPGKPYSSSKIQLLVISSEVFSSACPLPGHPNRAPAAESVFMCLPPPLLCGVPEGKGLRTGPNMYGAQQNEEVKGSRTPHQTLTGTGRPRETPHSSHLFLA